MNARRAATMLPLLALSAAASLGIAMGPAYAQTNATAPAGGNNTVAYSYNIYDGESAQPALRNSSVNYHDNATGYLVYPELANSTGGQLPAVIMIHEWWGLNEHIKSQADVLAGEGYVVLAVDLYGGEIAADFNRAMELSSSVRGDPASAIANLQDAASHLRSLEMVNGSRVASLGWCFGGDWSLQLALNSGENPLAATVVYYGRPATDSASLANVTWPVLGIFGNEDQSIPVGSVNEFAAALNETGTTNEIYIYEGVGHAFANPSGDNYAPDETIDAWHKTLAFLREHL